MINPRLISVTRSLIILTILLVSSTLPLIADSNTIKAQNSEDAIYDIIILSGDSHIRFFNENNSLLLIPLQEAIDKSLINNMTPKNIIAADPSASADVNLTLPNGTEVKYITYSLYRYYGFGEGSPKIWTITSTYVLRDKVLWLVIHVLVPPPEDIENYSVVSVLNIERALIIYKYINKTHFGVDIKLFDAYYGECAIPFDKSRKRFDMTVRFIVNRSSWIAKYWNGEEWVSAGMLPIAGPALDLTNMLYKLYKAYNDTVNYYLTHRDQLNILINKIKTVLESGNHTKIGDLMRNISHAPMPQEWRAFRTTYLGNEYKYNSFDGSAVGEIIEYYDPPHTDLSWVKTDFKKFREYKEELLNAVIDYLLNGTTEKLEKIIAENNAFAEYQPDPYKGGKGSLFSIFQSYGLPPFGISRDLLCPVDGLVGIPDILKNASYALLQLPCAPSIGNVEIVHNTTLASIYSLNSREEYLAVAIDRRLVEEWMVTSNNSLDRGLRVGVLQNVLSTVINKYTQALFNIVNGADPEEAFGEFQSYLKTSVLAAAFQFGGEKGKDMLESLISGKKPTSSEEITEDTTSESQGGEEDQGSEESTEGNVTNVSADNADRRTYIIIGSTIALIAVAIVALVLWSRRRK